MTPRVWVAAAVVTAVAAAVALSRLVPAGPREDIPPAYATRANPRPHDPRAVEAGGKLFQENCASCHGVNGDGRGPAAVGLNPSPADFRGEFLTRHSDAYLFFRLSEGKPGTAMPSFHGTLAEDERWAVIAYLRTLRDESDDRVVSSTAGR